MAKDVKNMLFFLKNFVLPKNSKICESNIFSLSRHDSYYTSITISVLLFSIAMTLPETACVDSAKDYKGYQVLQVKVESDNDLKRLRDFTTKNADFQLWSGDKRKARSVVILQIKVMDRSLVFLYILVRWYR